MNRANMMQLAHFITTGRKQIDMRNIIRGYDNLAVNSALRGETVNDIPCNTAACFVGWVTLMNLEEFRASKLEPYQFARQWLDLSELEAAWLFEPNDFKHPPRNQRYFALKVLRGETALTWNWLHEPVRAAFRYQGFNNGP